MKIVLKKGALLILIIVMAIVYGFTSNNVDRDFKAIHIDCVFQMPDDTGNPITLRRSADVIYSKDYLIVRERSLNTNTVVKLNPGTNEVKDQSMTIDSNYVYYISKRAEKYGLTYDCLSDQSGKHSKVNVDSLVKYFLSPPAFYYGAKSKGKDSVSVVRDEKKRILIEKYKNRRPVVQEPDSCYFYFTKKPMDFSFIMNINRDDNMHLYKAKIIYNYSPKGTFSNVNYDVKKFGHEFEITEIDVPEAEIKKRIDIFRNSTDN